MGGTGRVLGGGGFKQVAAWQQMLYNQSQVINVVRDYSLGNGESDLKMYCR